MTNHRLLVLKDKIIHGNAHDDAETLALADDLIRDETLEVWERLEALTVYDRIIGEPKPLYMESDLQSYLVEVDQLEDFREWSGGFSPDECDAAQIQEYLDTAAPDSECRIILHVITNDDRYYEIDKADLIEAANFPIQENKRVNWMRDRWAPAQVHSDSEVDIVIIPEDQEGWEAFDEYVSESVTQSREVSQ
ncbi:MAG: hypothetical protein HUJ26_19035 [Planctomycetaceae bacterium]|nr:hypothetical protein [Planctomycetaceae bacterium]